MEDDQKDEKKGILAGVDLDQDVVQVSCYHNTMEEPQTVGPFVGVDKFEIPLCLYMLPSSGQWFYGEGAKEYKGAKEGIYIDNIWQGCLLDKSILIQGQTYSYTALMVIFLKKVLRLCSQLGKESHITGLTLTVQELDDETIAVLQKITKNLQIPVKNVFFQDYKESFAYYVINQEKELWNREVFLFYFTGTRFLGYQLVVNQKIKPYEILIEQVLQEEFSQPEEQDPLALGLDGWFEKQIEKLFGKRLISAVYLIGRGFENDWMRASLRLLCHGRRVFQGKNLFTKGACYACMELLEWKKRTGLYKSGQALACQVRIPVIIKHKPEYVYVANPGEAWYAADCSIECIMDDCSEVNLEIIKPEKKVEVITLKTAELPKRPNLATRLQIHVEFLSSSTGRIVVRDMGLGEMYEASGLEWKKEFPL